MDILLTREEFNKAVFGRDSYHCAICKDKEDVVVHHILDRKCFKNGGYFAKNGITLCKQCHWRAEKGEYTCDELRKFAKIDEKLLPSDFNSRLDYDKFGNVIKNKLLKYPRTPHIFGSGIGKDDDPETIPHSELFNKHLVIEEKIDGASSGLSFNQDCELMLQCRGHYLLGNGDWPEFDQFKVWGNTFKNQIFDILSDRYIMYGEWMSAFHSVFYDALPHFFMEFDIYDRKEEVFLDTKRRHEMVSKMPMKIESVRVVGEGKFYSINSILALIGISAYISEQACDTLAKICDANKIPEKDKEIFLKLNQSRLMEGLYIKWEEDGIVKDRYKYVRPDFVQTILSYGKHWLDRPSMPNKMMGGASMFTLKGE